MENKNKKISKGYRLKTETHELILKIKQTIKADSDNAINTACSKFLNELKKNKKKGEL